MDGLAIRGVWVGLIYFGYKLSASVTIIIYPLSLSLRQLLEGSHTLDIMEKVPTQNERPLEDIKIVEIKVLDAKDIHSKIRI